MFIRYRFLGACTREGPPRTGWPETRSTCRLTSREAFEPTSTVQRPVIGLVRWASACRRACWAGGSLFTSTRPGFVAVLRANRSTGFPPPGERADILIDFSTLALGTTVVLRNDANAPFPDGTPPDARTVGQAMQFTVMAAPRLVPPPLPPRLNEIPKLIPNMPGRILTFDEVRLPSGRVAMLLNGEEWGCSDVRIPGGGVN